MRAAIVLVALLSVAWPACQLNHPAPTPLTPPPYPDPPSVQLGARDAGAD